MFVLCPHCQFLVAVDPVSGLPPASCPRCNGTLGPPVPAVPVEQAAPPIVEPAAPPAPASPPTLPEPPAPVAPVTAAAPPAPAAPVTPSKPGKTAKTARSKPVGQVAPERPAAPEPRSPVEGETLPVDPVPAASPPSEEAAETDDIAAPIAMDPPIVDDDSPTASAAPAAAGEVRETDGTAARTAMPRAPAVHHRRRSAAVIAALSLLLVLQLLLADRAQLATSAQWRPLLTLLCDGLRCSLPPWHEPMAFTVLDRNVTPDPLRPGVLHVTANVRNDARWPQALPRLLLTLSDADGRVAGERVFVPAEYLGTSATKNTLGSGQRIAIALDVVEPAQHIVAFTFDFL
jgi:hypothetical protein